MHALTLPGMRPRTKLWNRVTETRYHDKRHRTLLFPAMTGFWNVLRSIGEITLVLYFIQDWFSDSGVALRVLIARCNSSDEGAYWEILFVYKIE